MNRYKTYLFDLDGTLIDTTEMILRCFQNTLAPYESDVVKIKDAEILGSIGRPFVDQLDIFFESNSLEKPNYEYLSKKHMDFQGKIWKDYLKVFDEVIAVLQELTSRGATLAVVTSRKQPSAITFMKHVGIYNYFKLLVTPEATKHHKPHPEPALYAMKNLKTTPKECIFIGDSRFDIACAVAAGIDSFLVQRTEVATLWDGEDELAKPMYSRSSISSLIE